MNNEKIIVCNSYSHTSLTSLPHPVFSVPLPPPPPPSPLLAFFFQYYNTQVQEQTCLSHNYELILKKKKRNGVMIQKLDNTFFNTLAFAIADVIILLRQRKFSSF